MLEPGAFYLPGAVNVGVLADPEGDALLLAGVLVILTGLLFFITGDTALVLLFEAVGLGLAVAGWRRGRPSLTPSPDATSESS